MTSTRKPTAKIAELASISKPRNAGLSKNAELTAAVLDLIKAGPASVYEIYETLRDTTKFLETTTLPGFWSISSSWKKVDPTKFANLILAKKAQASKNTDTPALKIPLTVNQRLHIDARLKEIFEAKFSGAKYQRDGVQIHELIDELYKLNEFKTADNTRLSSRIHTLAVRKNSWIVKRAVARQADEPNSTKFRFFAADARAPLAEPRAVSHPVSSAVETVEKAPSTRAVLKTLAELGIDERHLSQVASENVSKVVFLLQQKYLDCREALNESLQATETSSSLVVGDFQLMEVMKRGRVGNFRLGELIVKHFTSAHEEELLEAMEAGKKVRISIVD